MMLYSEIRAEARSVLRGKWGIMAVVWLIIFALSHGVHALSEEFGTIVSLIVGGPFLLGVSTIVLKVYRKEAFQLEEVFGGFKDFSRALVAYLDRKSTRLNSSHVRILYAVFCLKKKKRITQRLYLNLNLKHIIYLIIVLSIN